MTDVKCRVKSCYYWGEGDVCVADSIMVDNNKTQKSIGRMEAGTLDVTDNIGKSADRSGLAHKSEETLCKTFRPKENHQNK